MKVKRNEIIKKGDSMSYNRDMFNIGGIKTNNINTTVDNSLFIQTFAPKFGTTKDDS